MLAFSNSHIILATAEDAPVIRDLLNSAYRGESSKQGWTTEANLIAGNVRTDESTVRELIDQPGSIFLLYLDDEGTIIGCVNLQLKGERIYLGMFSVSPRLQGGGIGKLLLVASEEYARQKHCKSIYMSVISVRTELINWYQRHGYADTGNRQVFIEDDISGKHMQELEFLILEKFLP